MAFADYKPHYLDITDKAGNRIGKVRPLNESDISLLWMKHEDAMEAVFQSVSGEHELAENVFGAAAISAIKIAPALVTDIICLASGEPDWDATHQAVSVMPVGMRLEILGATIRITLEAEGGLEKLWGLFALMRPAAVPESGADA